MAEDAAKMSITSSDQDTQSSKSSDTAPAKPPAANPPAPPAEDKSDEPTPGTVVAINLVLRLR